jgi:ABC-2 type transport system permease protein
VKVLRDTWLNIKQPVWLIVMLVQPIYFLFLFAPLLEPMDGMPGFENGAMETFVPGLIIMMALFGSAFVGFGLIAELRQGVIERMRVTPISRTALMLGRNLATVTTTVFQSLALVLLASLTGKLEIDWGGVFLMLLIVMLTAFMLAAVSLGLALVLKSEDALAPTINTLVQPIMLISGIMLPMVMAPAWLQNVADFNPFYYAVQASRELFAGNFDTDYVWQAPVILGALTIVLVWWATRKFARAVA